MFRTVQGRFARATKNSEELVLFAALARHLRPKRTFSPSFRLSRFTLIAIALSSSRMHGADSSWIPASALPLRLPFLLNNIAAKDRDGEK